MSGTGLCSVTCPIWTPSLPFFVVERCHQYQLINLCPIPIYLHHHHHLVAQHRSSRLASSRVPVSFRRTGSTVSATSPSYYGKSGNFTATVPLRKLQACNCLTLTSSLGLRSTSSDNDSALCRSSLRTLPFQTAHTRLLISYHYYRHTFGSVMRSWSRWQTWRVCHHCRSGSRAPVTLGPNMFA